MRQAARRSSIENCYRPTGRSDRATPDGRRFVDNVGREKIMPNIQAALDRASAVHEAQEGAPAR